ncbi:hypothetical protein Dsin_021554 [Dipteronia sinensis]|uniref:RNase H type-1 domain-containing protein n=1 Tax=Dipteronia sinensis TaxID=43782 RepID=A0AAD9ZZZ7_9ROSI|nr:hypothetical protein Dsin_021554 [Dipteronia sinensis]
MMDMVNRCRGCVGYYGKVEYWFWWGKRYEAEDALVFVGKLCKAKHERGLGFRDIRDFNKAMLEKQGWWLLKNLGLLIAKVMKGIGVVIRDCHGHVMASLYQNINALYQPQIIEAMVILKCANMGVVINDILFLLQEVNVSSINFVPRLANNVAHVLAKLALTHEGELVWLEDCPLCMDNLVLRDCPASM